MTAELQEQIAKEHALEDRIVALKDALGEHELQCALRNGSVDTRFAKIDGAIEALRRDVANNTRLLWVVLGTVLASAAWMVRSFISA